ncbi:xylan 1,4-beta-xylosidase [Rhizodiscina lignyota]|uniref:Xylan 1,4-beta-xylosidase n=1 Tax=Rhizodiscina lignyota TaxID=1504668 RepID=A0A9P4MBA1_9PEZI|nr:xylan 1,4-beta-xylosidase [Rhizodiscina lignyota]
MLWNLAFLALPAVTARQVSIQVDVGQSMGPYVPTARFFGADEPDYAFYPDGSATLNDLGHLGPHQTYFRTHNLLTTGNGLETTLKFGSTNIYTEDAEGNPIYNYTVVDRIFDSYLKNNVKPYVQAGFMPEALAINPLPYFFNFTPTSAYNDIYTGWSHPPKSYEKWGELIYQWAKHCLERYGLEEVNSWYWEIWNEPNIPYWNGTIPQFYKLHDYAVNGIRRAIPTARVGGAEVAGGPSGDYLGNFIEHCLDGTNYATGEKGTPLDFVSFHAKGAPNYINTSSTSGYVQMGIAAQLQNVNDAFKVIASYPQTKSKPIVVGEQDPDGCAACITPQYGYRNGLLYPSFIAAGFTRTMDLSKKYGVNHQGSLTWAFEYDHDEYFSGFRVVTTNRIDKPVLNAHRMLVKMTGTRVKAISSGQQPLEDVVTNGVRNATDVGAISSVDGDKAYVFIWHYHDDDLPKPDAEIDVAVEGLSWNGNARLTHYRLDNEHSNSYTKWMSMGSPQNPTAEQHAELRAAGLLATLGKPTALNVEGGCAKVSLSLPIHALSLLVIEKEDSN